MRRLNTTRFGTVLQHCGADETPGTAVNPEWRVWTHRDTTPDQQRIEAHLPALLRPESAILHIGVGNSGLARSFSGAVARILGTTVDVEEKTFADHLEIPNYEVELVNKHSKQITQVDGRIYLIVDNNPASFACCLFHLTRMMACYAELLAENGMLLAAEPGLRWTVGDDTSWSLSWDDWVVIAETLSLQPKKLDEFVYCMRRPPAAERSASMSVPILMYHSVADEGPKELSRYRVTPAALA